MTSTTELAPREAPMPPLRFSGDIRERLPKIEGREIRPINRVLIVCTGEMEIRAIDACRQMGIPATLAITKETANTLGARYMEELSREDDRYNIVNIGEGEPRSTLGNENLLVAFAKQVGADAIYPGYGPVAENVHFVRRLEKEVIRFIGPTADAMLKLGDKVELKKLATTLGVPVIPGGAVYTVTEAHQKAEEIGYPVLVKPAGEGGGRGILQMNNSGDLANYVSYLRDEVLERARKLQGNDEIQGILIEKYITNTKHVEIQVFGDGEDADATGARECDLQIEKHKVVEISPPPSTTISEEKLEEIKQYSVALTKAVKYKGPLTFEWLVDKDGNPYLMEVNTRIQLEHTLTEILNGFDYVQMQLALEEGYGLPEEIQERKDLVVMQLRLYAKDPFPPQNPDDKGGKFAARHGPISIAFPEENPHLRIDRAYGENQEGEPPFIVPPGYDYLLAKYVVVAKDLAEAIEIGTKALDETQLSLDSPPTIKLLLRWAINTPAFKNGAITTTWLESAWEEEIQKLSALSTAMREQSSGPITKEAPPAPEIKKYTLRETSVLVFRHGEDEYPTLSPNMNYDAFRRYINHPDSGLNHKGKDQLTARLDLIDQEELAKIKHIYTSNIKRARQSAEEIQAYIYVKTGNTVTIEESSYLAEVTITADILPEEEYNQLLKDNYGNPEEAAREVYRRWEKGVDSLDESHKATSDLIDNFLYLLDRKIQEMSPDEKVIVVTHGLISRAWQYKMMGGRLSSDGKFDYESLMKIEPLANGGFFGLKRLPQEPDQGSQLFIPTKAFRIIENPLSADTHINGASAPDEHAGTIVLSPSDEVNPWTGRGPGGWNFAARAALVEGTFNRPHKNPKW